MAALGDAFFVQTFTTTLQKYEKKLVDNVIKTHPGLDLFATSAGSDTGRGLAIPLRAASLGATGKSDSSGTHSTAVSTDIMGMATYDWATEIITPFRLKHSDILQNSGPEQIVSLIDAYVTGATADHQDYLVARLHALSASWSTGDPLSLDILIADTDTTSTTTSRLVGNIRGGTSTAVVTNKALTTNVATLTVGKTDFIVGDTAVVAGVDATFNGTVVLTAVTSTTISYAVTHADVASTPSTGSVVVSAIKDFWKATSSTSSKAAVPSIIAAIRNVSNSIFKASRKLPTHVLCGFDVFEEVEAFLEGKTQYFNPADSAETRFRKITFGGLEFRMDPDMPVDRAYLINMPTLRFRYLAGEFMKAYPAQSLNGTLDTVVPLATTLLCAVAERRANGVLIRTA